MPDFLFSDAQTLGALTENTSQFVAAGVGFSFVAWAVGFGVWFVIDALRF